MTSIIITPDTAKKRLRFSGDCIAVGEHVGVTVSGFADKIAGGKLRLRVILGKRTLAKFPLVMADPRANPPVIGDQWTNPQGTTDAYCELNLNTVQAQKYIRLGMDCLIVLDDVDIPQKYGASDLFISPWCKECGEDTPYNLDEYPDIVAEMKDDIEEFRTTVEEAKTAANGAVTAANTAANAAQTSSNAAATAQNAASRAESAAETARNDADAAVEAISRTPRIDETTHRWMVWDAEHGEFVDTGVSAIGPQGEKGDDGITPHIGSNGHWFVGTTDTGISAQGPKGDKGDKGEQGDKGDPGSDADVIGKLPLRALPKYLHILAFDDTYIEDARAWYETHANDSLGGCSAVRKGGLLGRNYDWNFDEMAEFVVKVSAKDGRHASVGVANVRTELTEEIVCSGVFSPLYRVLPGRTVDGINDAGVVAEVNVIPRDAEKDPVKSATRNLHAFEVVRHVLDNYANAHDAAVYVAAHYYIPSGDYSYHWMIADANGTYIVEDGAVIDTETTMTNYRVGVADDPYGNGYARRTILGGTGTVADLLEAVKFTNAYASGWPWPDEFASADAGITHGETDALKAWADTYVTPLIDPATRKPKARGNGCWQTCHSCIYDFAAKTMAICVQEDFAKRYVFAAGGAKVELEDTVTETSANGVKSSGIWSWVKSLLPSWLTPTREEPPTHASVAAKYTKPSGGIPKTDLAEEVQASLDKSVKMNESGIASVRQMMVGPNDAQAAYDSEYIYTGDGGYYFPWSEHYAEIAPSHRFAVVSQIEPKADRSSIAPEYDAESAYTVGQFVYHDGKIYQCTTAIAAPGESWNPAHWAERKVDDFFKENNTLLGATIEAKIANRLANIDPDTASVYDLIKALKGE